ncbi:MAG TPA: 30S ribosomal protein S8 [Candidatus Polarisedimenticolia bacterium]|nr:30S ribosomal protein S8 [Candidatus Polarisedimenticolia bacterium]
MNDPISDMLTRIRNGVLARHPRVDMPHSKVKQAIAAILKDEGYIAEAATIEKGGFRTLRVTLRYDAEGRSYLSGIARVSKQGKRVYARHDAVPQVFGGLGVTIVSTPKGMMSGRKARKSGIGGEVVCSVW